MNRYLKLTLYVLGSLALVLAGFYVFVRLYVGGVNVPVGDYELSAGNLDDRIQVPDGFSMGLYGVVDNARLLRFTRTGDLLVANPSLGKITLLERDANGDGKADGKRVLIDGLNGPNGMDFYRNFLYIAETDAIGRVPFDHDTGQLAGDYERIVTGLPGGGNHWKKTLRFGPDGLMYVTMGSSCNVCIEKDPRRAAMVRYNPDGTGEEIFARGLRNSAGFDWSPLDGEIYATDNGRDMLGDNFPPCELNLIRQGQHYGWPYANGDKVPDPDYGEGHEDIIEKSVPPVHKFRPHNAPLGMVFVRGDALPAAYRNAAIVALHGSWNRSEKDGYKVVSLHWDGQGNITEKDFVTGFLKDDDVIGRPAEVAQGPGGAIYVADDYAGAVYRVAWGEAQTFELPPNEAAPVYSAEETLASLDSVERDRLAKKGAALFKQYNCAQCHRDDEAALKKLEDIGSKYNLETLPKWLERPKPPMPVFPLSDDDKRALSVYLIETY